MSKKIFLIVPILTLSIFLSQAQAEKYAIQDYVFVWNVAQEGNVALKLQKDPEGIFCILSSLGGKLATLKLTPTKSIKIGQVLLTANDYYKKHQDFYKQEKEKYTIAYNEEHYDKVDVDGHKVIFHSQPKGTPFEVRVSEDKTFAVVAVILDRDQAVKIGKYMVDSEELASIVQAHVKP